MSRGSRRDRQPHATRLGNAIERTRSISRSARRRASVSGEGDQTDGAGGDGFLEFAGLFDEGQKERLTTAIAGALGQADERIQQRQLCHFFRADPDYGQRVASKLGIDVEAMMEAVPA